MRPNVVRHLLDLIPVVPDVPARGPAGSTRSGFAAGRCRSGPNHGMAFGGEGTHMIGTPGIFLIRRRRSLSLVATT